MNVILHIPSLLVVLLSLLCCNTDTDATPVPVPVPELGDPAIQVVTPLIRETSGIADSKAFSGYLWGHEDSGTPSQLHLIKYDGTVEKKVIIKGALNRDWEEMALANGTIFIGDIGDNQRVFENYWFYQFPEPGPGVDTITTYETIMFRYPDGAHDAEAFLVDPETRHIYIITKRDEPSQIYKLTYPYSDTEINILSQVGSLTFSGVVAGAISTNGQEIILKTYPQLLHYTRSAGQSLEQALQGTPKSLFYQLEPQGEAVTFANDNSGVFTLSEKGYSTLVNLYFYPRKK
jgi:hypothetical protein